MGLTLAQRQAASVAIATRTNAPAGPRKAGCRTSGARRPGGIHADTYRELNPAAIQREIQALTEHLLTMTTTRKDPATNHPPRSPLRAHLDMSHRAVHSL